MAFLFSPSSQSNFFKTTAISLTILTTLSFYLLHLPSPPPHLSNPPKNPPKIPPFLQRRSLYTSLTTPSCSTSDLTSTNGLFNYFSFHSCLFQENPFLSIPFLALSVLLQFYILVKTAQDRFSVVVTKLCTHLKLSPSMGAVTLLALGNGAPDVFASVAAVRGGQARTGFGAILSAGTFVSAFVVGFVAIYAAPFAVDPGPFVRDVLFYLTAALFLFYVYLSAEIFLWQALGFVAFYLFFVGIVFWMDLGTGSGKGRRRGGGGDGSDVGLIRNGEVQKELTDMDCESGEVLVKSEDSKKQNYGFWRILEKHLHTERNREISMESHTNYQSTESCYSFEVRDAIWLKRTSEDGEESIYLVLYNKERRQLPSIAPLAPHVFSLEGKS